MPGEISRCTEIAALLAVSYVALADIEYLPTHIRHHERGNILKGVWSSLQWLDPDPEIADVSPYYDDVREKLLQLYEKAEDPKSSDEELRADLTYAQEYTIHRMIETICSCEAGIIPLSNEDIRTRKKVELQANLKVLGIDASLEELL